MEASSQLLAFAILLFGKEPWYLWVGSWMGLRANMAVVTKSLAPAKNLPQDLGCPAHILVSEPIEVFCVSKCKPFIFMYAVAAACQLMVSALVHNKLQVTGLSVQTVCSFFFSFLSKRELAQV
jgi:hypothetical protein